MYPPSVSSLTTKAETTGARITLANSRHVAQPASQNVNHRNHHERNIYEYAVLAVVEIDTYELNGSTHDHHRSESP